MCGRYALATDGEAVQQAFDLDTTPDVQPRYNIAPSQPVAVITNDAPKELTYVQWGLIPSWSKDAAIANKLINARSETVDEKPSFRSAFKRRRCLIPANGFFEWQKQGSKKVPHFIHLGERAGDLRLFAFAGLWETWTSPEGDDVLTCTILTTEPNERVQPLHHRMAVILEPEHYDVWLDDVDDSGLLKSLLKPYPPDDIQIYEVSTAVNNPRNDSPDLIKPYQSPLQPSLI